MYESLDNIKCNELRLSKLPTCIRNRDNCHSFHNIRHIVRICWLKVNLYFFCPFCYGQATIRPPIPDWAPRNLGRPCKMAKESKDVDSVVMVTAIGLLLPSPLNSNPTTSRSEISYVSTSKFPANKFEEIPASYLTLRSISLGEYGFGPSRTGYCIGTLNLSQLYGANSNCRRRVIWLSWWTDLTYPMSGIHIKACRN
jgi:hypothetical protein